MCFHRNIISIFWWISKFHITKSFASLHLKKLFIWWNLFSRLSTTLSYQLYFRFWYHKHNCYCLSCSVSSKKISYISHPPFTAKGLKDTDLAQIFTLFFCPYDYGHYYDYRWLCWVSITFHHFQNTRSPMIFNAGLFLMIAGRPHCVPQFGQ